MREEHRRHRELLDRPGRREAASRHLPLVVRLSAVVELQSAQDLPGRIFGAVSKLQILI
jgi:hypothetical protein